MLSPLLYDPGDGDGADGVRSDVLGTSLNKEDNPCVWRRSVLPLSSSKLLQTRT